MMMETTTGAMECMEFHEALVNNTVKGRLVEKAISASASSDRRMPS
jgi:hypothetical protein